MFALVTAAGQTKEEIIRNLREAVDDFEQESANNALRGGVNEYQLFDNDFICMADVIRGALSTEMIDLRGGPLSLADCHLALSLLRQCSHVAIINCGGCDPLMLGFYLMAKAQKSGIKFAE